MTDELIGRGPLAAVLDNLLFDPTPNGELELRHRVDRLPYVLTTALREAGPRGTLMWRDFRSLRSSLQKFSAAGVEEFPCWYISAHSVVPIDTSSKAFSKYFTHVRPHLRRRNDVRHILDEWTKFCENFHDHFQKRDKDVGRPGFTSTQTAGSRFAQLLSGSLSNAGAKTLSTKVARSIPVEVHNVSRGYRIHWTHQYWMSPVVFGSRCSAKVTRKKRWRAFGSRRPPTRSLQDRRIISCLVRIPQEALGTSIVGRAARPTESGLLSRKVWPKPHSFSFT